MPSLPGLPAGYRTPLPSARPAGLRRRRLATGTELWRIDKTSPGTWTWSGFADPRYRFDPASGLFRTRYAATRLVAAFRERYRAAGLAIPEDHAGHYLVRLVTTRPVWTLDLRSEHNLDVLDVDDQISTGQHAQVWDTCHRLADAVRRWWTDLDAIVYRSRTTPSSSVNLAFFDANACSTTSWPLSGRSDVLDQLITRHGFTVDWEM